MCNSKRIIPLFFVLLIFFTVFCLCANVKGQTVTKLGDFNAYGVTNKNPTVIGLKISGTTNNYIVYAYSPDATTTTITLKVWLASEAPVLSTTFSTSTKQLRGIWILRHGDNADTIDGFWVLVIRNNNNELPQYHFAFVNLTTSTVTVTTATLSGFTQDNAWVNEYAVSNVIKQGSTYYVCVGNRGLLVSQYYYILHTFAITPPSTIATVTYAAFATNTSSTWKTLTLTASPVYPNYLRVLALNSYQYYAFTIDVSAATATQNKLDAIDGQYWQVSTISLGSGQYYATLYMPKVIAQSYTSNSETITQELLITHTGTAKTYLAQWDTIFTFSPPSTGLGIKNNIIISALMPLRDTRPYLYCTNGIFVYYAYTDKLYFINRVDETLENVNTGTTEPPEKLYIFANNAYAKIQTGVNSVSIYYTVSLEEAITITPPTTSPTLPPEDDENFVTSAITQIVPLGIVLVLLLIPAALMGVVLGQIGAALGLAVGAVICVLAGYLPTWAIVVIGLGVAVLALHKIGILKLGGGGGDEAD